jgi:hypothetical protein
VLEGPASADPPPNERLRRPRTEVTELVGGGVTGRGPGGKDICMSSLLSAMMGGLNQEQHVSFSTKNDMCTLRGWKNSDASTRTKGY